MKDSLVSVPHMRFLQLLVCPYFVFVNSLFYKYDKMCFYLVWVKTYVFSLYVTIFNILLSN